MTNTCKFKPQLQVIMLDGIAVGGFNIIDIKKLYKLTKIPVIVVMRDYPDFKKIEKALKKLKKEKKMQLLKNAGEIHKTEKIWIQVVGLPVEKAKKIIKISSTRSFVAEPIRVAHIIASGVVDGESRGRA